MRLLLSMLGIACLTGCASTAPNASLDMQQYVGRPVSKLVKQLGSPEISYKDAQLTTLTYSPIVTEIATSTETTVPSAAAGLYSNPVTVKSPDVIRKVYADCQVHFSVKDNIVQSWAAQGSACPPAMLQH